MPVQEDADQTYKLFAVGDKVNTPDGPGTVTSVQFNTAKYNTRWELEPPQIVVELDRGDTIHTCLCELELPHTKKGTQLIHQEFDRLWPPVTDEVPADADSMIPEGDEDDRAMLKSASKMRMHHTRQALTYSDLDPKSQERARERYRQLSYGDPILSEIITDDLSYQLADLGYYNEDIRWNHSYSQGDGLAFYGVVEDPEKLLKRLDLHRLLPDDPYTSIYINIRKSEVFHLSDHANTMEVDVKLDVDEDIMSIEDAEAVEEIIEGTVQEDVKRVSKELFDFVRDSVDYYDSDERIEEELLEGTYEFDEPGRML